MVYLQILHLLSLKSGLQQKQQYQLNTNKQKQPQNKRPTTFPPKKQISNLEPGHTLEG